MAAALIEWFPLYAQSMSSLDASSTKPFISCPTSTIPPTRPTSAISSIKKNLGHRTDGRFSNDQLALRELKLFLFNTVIPTRTKCLKSKFSQLSPLYWAHYPIKYQSNPSTHHFFFTRPPLTFFQFTHIWKMDKQTFFQLVDTALKGGMFYIFCYFLTLCRKTILTSWDSGHMISPFNLSKCPSYP